ncbi:MAG: TusE/DsrC/DsvC family sulfur relay protein [Cocleimonas sp.]|nr:TusE/DsrC/DsvC family sulfur relay protein [Cocleimonas sp.]
MSTCMRTAIELPIARCPDGYLKHPEEWTETIAKQLAEEWNGLVFKDKEHFPLLYFIREHYEEHQTTPDVREATKYLVKTKGMDKKEAKKYLFKLFPHGYMQQGCQLAGMRRPTAWCVG